MTAVKQRVRSALLSRRLRRKRDWSLRQESGEPCRIRTCDPLIKSQLLYQLS